MATRTISDAGGNWTSTGTWVEGAVPIAGDTVVATATSGNLTIDDDVACDYLNLNDYTGTLTHTSAKTLTVGGFVTFDTTMTYVCNQGLIIINCGSATFTRANHTFYDVTINNSGTISFNGSGTFTNLTINGTSAISRVQTLANTYTTVTGVLTFAGVDDTARLLVSPNYKVGLSGVRYYDIRGATISVSYTDFSYTQFRTTSGDLDLSGATGGSGDCGGNTMYDGGTLTFTSAVTQTWQNADGGDWSAAANWTSRVPLPQDNVVMGIAYNTSKTVTADMVRLGRDIDWTGATYTTDLTFVIGNDCSTYGSIDLTDLPTFTPGTYTVTFDGAGSNTLTSNGHSWYSVTTASDCSLSDALTVTNIFTVLNMAFDANDFNVTCNRFYSYTSTDYREIYMGAGTWTITEDAAANIFYISSSKLTLASETSTLVFSGVSTNVKRIYCIGTTTLNNITFTGGGTGAFRLGSSSTSNYITTGAITISNTNTPTILFDSTYTSKFTISSLTAEGDATHQITLKTYESGTQATLEDTSGLNSVEYCTIQDIEATGGARWEAYLSEGNVNDDNNSGWVWADTTINSDAQIKSPGGTFFIRSQKTLDSSSNIFKIYSNDINSNSFIEKITQHTLSSDAYIFSQSQKDLNSDTSITKSGSANLGSDSYILKNQQKTLDSDSNVLVISSVELNSDSHTLYITEHSINSSAFVLKSGEEGSLYGNGYIKQTYDTSVSSNAYILDESSNSLNSNVYILKITGKTLDSNSNILKVTDQTLDSDASIFKTYQKTLESDAFVQKTEQETLDSWSYISGRSNINSDASIKKLNNRATITSLAHKKKIEYHNLSSIADIIGAVSTGITSDTKILASYDNSLNSIAYIKKTKTKTTITCQAFVVTLEGAFILSDANILKETPKTLSSDAHIEESYQENINSDASVLKAVTEDLTSDGVIAYSVYSNSLESNYSVLQDTQESILSDAEIYLPQYTETLDSDAHIFPMRRQVSLDSDAEIYLPQYTEDLDADISVQDTSQASIDSVSDIEKIVPKSLNSTAYVFKSYSPTLDSLSWIDLIMQEDLDSDSYTLKETPKTLNSAAYIYEASVSSLIQDAYIKKKTQKTLTSSSYIQEAGTNGLNSRAHILKITQKTLSSSYRIRTQIEVSLDSDAYIEYKTQKTLSSSAYIHKIVPNSLSSDAYVGDTEQENLNSILVILAGTAKGLESDAMILTSYQNNINSTSYIYKEGEEDSIASDAMILQSYTATLNSDAAILASTDSSLTSNAYILADYQKDMLSDSYILKEVQESISSDAYILDPTQQTLASDARILADYQKTLNSDAFIIEGASSGLTSDAYILADYTTTLSSDAYISEASEDGINSDAMVLQSYQKDLNSDFVVNTAYQKTLTSDSWITGIARLTSDAHIVFRSSNDINSDAMVLYDLSRVALDSSAYVSGIAHITSDLYILGIEMQTAISADAEIVLPNGADVFDWQNDDVLGEWEFKKKITYRRFCIDTDNASGDIIRSDYTDYSIYGEVQITDIHKEVTKAGQSGFGDAALFLPSEIKYSEDGSIVGPSFRPQINDEVKEDGIWYRIFAIQPHYIGESEISFECRISRLENENPSYAWNSNYVKYEQPGQPGRGYD